MHVLTLPNMLSLSRIGFAAAIAWSLLRDLPWLAPALFACAVATDFMDGALARRRRQVTALGTRLDHGSDALFVTALCATLAHLGVLPWLLPALIALAAFQYLFDSPPRAALRASGIGRVNGIGYFVIVGAAIVVHVYAPTPGNIAALNLFAWIAIVTTLASIAERAIYAIAARRG